MGKVRGYFFKSHNPDTYGTTKLHLDAAKLRSVAAERLLRVVVGSAVAITIFSVMHRSHLLEPHLCDLPFDLTLQTQVPQLPYVLGQLCLLTVFFQPE